jgi:serine/threonine protein kinase/class 3 adenylate cyclase
MSLGGYRLVSQVGAGRDGVAYRAAAENGGAEVALLDLSRARGDARRWQQVAPRLRLAAQLEHPAAIRVLELELAGDRPYVILEWVGTTTLAESAGGAGAHSRAKVMELARALAGALCAAHRIGLASGRIGPQCVLLVQGNQPKIDFTGAACGFPAAPEPVPGCDADPLDAGPVLAPAAARAADLQSLGDLLAWLLTRRTAQEGRGPGPTQPDESSAFGELVRKLRAGDPSERPSAQEVEQELVRLLAPLDATGEWAKSTERLAPATSFAQTGDSEPSTVGSDFGRLGVDARAGRLGRYRLLEKLGEGGQGIVYRGEDTADGSIVAIKVLRRDRVERPEDLRRFRKEARLLAEANNPYVVNLLEFNEDDGVPYMVLEFVAGVSLAQLLAKRTRLAEREALAIMAAVARGLTEAHERGIVHRDIKPSNILLLDAPPTGASSITEQDGFALAGTLEEGPHSRPSGETTTLASSTGEGPALPTAARARIKLSDFGLARHIVDTESMALTTAGALVGTPRYMAPEQWTGRAVDPRTDVYAMGATLFHILAGCPPFAAETRDELCGQHCHAPPPALATLNPGASDGVARIVERALCKQPEDRYVDAGAMLGDMEALLHGRPTDLAIHPRLPECDPRRVLEFEFRWELESSPRQLWPLVTNTNRLDRAIGFPPLMHKTRYEPGRGVRNFIEGRKAGMVEIGEEHPYEWLEPRRMSVLREYSQGPFRWLVSVVELLPRPGGGTTLVHRLRLEPSSWAIRVGSRWGVGGGLRKSLERVYKRIDATVKSQQHGASPGVDPFEEPGRMPAARRQRLERLLDGLAGRGIDPEVIERLGELVARGPAQEIARIRPLALAQRFRLDPAQVVAACLHGASLGLFEMHWDLLCPICRISSQVTDTLRAIAGHAHCQACHLDFQLDFANAIELFFRVHPEVRAADLRTYCIGGPAHSPHALAQLRVAANERIEVDLELPAGSYRLRGPQLPWSVDFQVQSAATSRRWEIDLGSPEAPECPAALRSGGQFLRLCNPHERELLVRIERTAQRSDALTAARAASLPLFRELFPHELLAPGQLATVSTVTFLVAALDAARADSLYEALGDAQAFGVIHRHLQCLGDGIRQGGGEVIKTMGEEVLASFGDVTAAVRTALELPNHLDRIELVSRLAPRLGVHRGAAMAATLNEHLDYFGTTARQAAGILRHARDGELVLTQAVAADPEVAALLRERRLDTEVVPTDLVGHPHVIRLRCGGKSAGDERRLPEQRRRDVAALAIPRGEGATPPL